jgi:hypothetical protein
MASLPVSTEKSGVMSSYPISHVGSTCNASAIFETALTRGTICHDKYREMEASEIPLRFASSRALIPFVFMASFI